MEEWEYKFYKTLTKEELQIYKRLSQKIVNTLFKEI